MHVDMCGIKSNVRAGFVFLLSKFLISFNIFHSNISDIKPLTHKIYCSKAPMADFSEVCEELFRIFFEEELCNLRVL